jgi:hypothetical protein
MPSNRTTRLVSSLFITLTATATALAAGCGGGRDSVRAEPDAGQGAGPDIRGRWLSPCLPQDGGQSFSLDFDLTQARWALDYAAFGDGDCQVPFLTVHIEGPWEYERPSAAVEGAFEARFGFSEKTVTPHMEAAAGFLASEAGCGRDDGFAEGQATSIYDHGCPGLGQYPRAQCDADYDLVALAGGNLQFGARPADNDMCAPARRPTALSGLPLARP